MMNRTDSELPLLSEEKFDFELPLSPLSGKEDNEDEDDEVFVGPVGHKEKCVSVNIEMQAEVLSEPHTKSPVEQLINWSPLTGDKFVEIFKEAHLLVKQFEKITDNSDEASKENIPIRNKNAEQFVEDSDSKLNVFQNVKGTVVSPIKRETFCVQDSPFRILPPAVQQHLKISTGTSSPLKMHNGTVSPSRKNMRCSLTKKSKKDPSFSYTKQILPSKMIPLKATEKITKAGQLPIAKSNGQKSFSPARRQRNSSDHSSDNISIASDVSDSSQNSSFLGKVTTVKSSKIGLKSTALKVPSLQRRSTGVVGRKSSSSSSSVSSVNSSMNSSLSISPLGKSKMNISLNSSLSKPKVNCWYWKQVCIIISYWCKSIIISHKKYSCVKSGEVCKR
uniref:G2 and S phase-expressed protein 1 N-terminal domain-containing protein n=1 Tax=Erpetoichthys calabaricus TaxID=27687 RepID=A0A8C4RTV2_ERPCA